MKLSDYLWTRIQLDTVLPDNVSPEQVTGELNSILNGESIISDTTGEVMSVRDAESVYGRNYNRLNEAYKENNKALFTLTCVKQQLSDDEWEKAKRGVMEGHNET